MTESADAYFETRLSYDRKRDVLWKTLTESVFQSYVDREATVVELGAGWCDFINNIRCRRRIAVDLWSGIEEQAAAGVEAHVSSADNLDFLETDSVDLVFASNLLEHLTHDEISALLKEARRVLKPSGRIMLLQPNFRLCAKNYFDDYTHVSIWSDISMTAYLEANGWNVERSEGRFLPLTVKSRLPVSSTLIRAYLRSPIKPKAGQMLLVASPAGPPALA